MRFKISLALVLTAGLIAAGCGDDDEETTTTTGATGASGASGEAGAEGLLPADFAAEADAICKAGDAEIEAALDQEFGQSNKEPTEAEQVKVFAEVGIPLIQDQIDDIRALGDPEEGAEEFATFLDEAEAAVDEIEADPSLLGGNSDPFADVNKQAKELGLTECAD